MAYSDFTLERVARVLGVTTAPGDLFPDAPRVEVPADLAATLAKRTQLALISEKSRSESIVAPILYAVRDHSPRPLAIFSGHKLEVDQSLGLTGECDFLLSLAPAVLPLRSPIITIVEAKKNDIEGGLGQCAAQMVAADRFNQEAGESRMVHGCVTNGVEWQFLRLEGKMAQIDERRYVLAELPEILGALQTIIVQDAPIGTPSPGT